MWVYVVTYFTSDNTKFGGVFSGESLANAVAKQLRDRFGFDACVTRFAVNQRSQGDVVGLVLSTQARKDGG